MSKLPRFLAAFLSLGLTAALFASAGAAPAPAQDAAGSEIASTMEMPEPDPLDQITCKCHVGGRICDPVPCNVPCSVSCPSGL